jgi:hypothetical protein
MQTKTRIQHGAKRGSIVVWSEHRTITYQTPPRTETIATWHIGTVKSVTNKGEARLATNLETGATVELIDRNGHRARFIGNDVLVANKDQVDIAAVKADTSLHHGYGSITEIREALAQYKVSATA